ncbi:MAG: acyl-CoA thioesterase family protein [Acidiferrobacterales bacterium]
MKAKLQVVEQEIISVDLRPRFEGSNICTWIGFKHVMYLVEEAILDYFRSRGMVPRRLFEEHGLCLEIVDSSVRILHALHMDDLVQVEVRPVTQAQGRELHFSVQIMVDRAGKNTKALTGKVAVMFRQESPDITSSRGTAFPAPAEIAPYVSGKIDRALDAGGSSEVIGDGRGVNRSEDILIRQLVPADANAFVWKWHIPYFYCHFSERLQHSGYLRLVEEVVDLFLADRGISIATMLKKRRWIPVVPQAQLSILREALMEETIYTVYTVQEIFKNVTYNANVDFYVLRDGALVRTAQGRITHGYAEILNRRDWALVNFDETVMAALYGKAARQ